MPAPPTWRGFFFCLASAEGAELLFCPYTIHPHTSVYSAFCVVHASYTVHAAKRHTELYRGLSGYLPHSNAADTRPTQAAIIPPAPRWSAPQRRNPPAHTRHQRHAGRYTGQHSRPIIIRYIRVQRCACRGSMQDSAAYHRPCQPGGVSILPTPGGLRSGTGQQTGRTGSARPLHPAGQSSSRSATGGAEPLTAVAVSLFGLSPDSQ